MTPTEFIAKWQKARLSERSACQQHFCDLCDLLEHPKPAEEDPEGTHFTFERGVRTVAGSQGWADVWKRGHFGWEYKRRHKDLKAAYDQLLLYREDLENPPLLVVSDMDRFEVHTNFTGTAKKVHAFNLAGLSQPRNLEILRKVFWEPETLRPEVTTIHITEEAAERFGQLADGLRLRGVGAHQAAHFLMKLMFCMFGEDIRLLPEELFTRILEGSRRDPVQLARRLEGLFAAMAKGGDFGADPILRFNGGLFADAEVVKLTIEEINTLLSINGYDWASVEPSIFGTLFERTLDPGKRSQIGAHYTGKADILTLLEPVLMAPLRREWVAVRQKCEEGLWPKVKDSAGVRSRAVSARTKDSKERRAFDRALLNFAERLHHVTVLDPACGSGNFLYVAINLLLDLEKEVISFAASHGLSMIPHVRPTQLAGIEINPYAQELASVVIWIGYLQWMHHNGFRMPTDPVLEPIETIRSMDAILDLSDPENPREPEWPEAEFIVGNPPFLGNKRMRSELSEAYVKPLWALFGDRIPATSDLCCYWFEKALATIQRGATRHAGLLATTTISQVSTRRVLERITDTSRIFFAVSDREWILDGAAVRIALIGFGRTAGDAAAQLDGKQVPRINPDLTAGPDITRRNRLTENVGLCFMGVTKVGDFDIDHDLALQFMQQPNVNGRPNSDVLRPFRNGSDIVRTCSDRWVIDFGVGTSEGNAAQYQGPFEHVVKQVKPQRAHNGREAYRERWWIHGEARPGFRHAVAGQVRYVGTARVAEHRLFVWLDSLILPDSKVIAITLSRDSALGMLHSRVHEVWTNATCGLHGGERRTYNPTTCFETFPMPEPTPEQEAAIAEAAKQLDDLRNRWLNPPEWTKAEVLEFPGSGDGPWARYVLSPDKHRIGTVRWPRVVPKDPDCAESLKQRTLTNLYNERPAWLDLAHKRLDEAVFAAYGWNAGMGDERLLEKLLELNLARAGGETG